MQPTRWPLFLFLTLQLGCDAGSPVDSGDPDAVDEDPDLSDTDAAADSDAPDTANPACAEAVEGTLYATSAVPWSGDESAPTPMCTYADDVLLIVNIASQCGYTPQMAGLQSLEDALGGEGFRVLGFLSDDFGNQAGTDEQIGVCESQYATTFDTFAVGHVTDPDGAGPTEPQDVWRWLLSQPNPGPASAIAPTWNFHKYLVRRDGTLVGHWDSGEYPGDDPQDPNDSFETDAIVVAIREELAR